MQFAREHPGRGSSFQSKQMRPPVVMQVWPPVIRVEDHSQSAEEWVRLKQYLHHEALALPEKARLQRVGSIIAQDILGSAAALCLNLLSYPSHASPAYSMCALIIKVR